MNNKIVVHIADETFNLVSEESEQHMRKVAACVSAKVDEAVPGGIATTQQKLLIASLNIADDYLRIKSAYEEMKQAFRRTMEDNALLKEKLRRQQEEQK